MSEVFLPPPLPSLGGGDLILDVGANAGDFAIAMAQNHLDMAVLAFEPMPSLAAAIRDRAASLGLRNLTCLELAVDETPRVATFHVADHYDRGVSSLLRFDREGISQNDYWRERPDLHFTNNLQVQVCRLDALLQADPPARISFIKIDAQGVDLNVLRSLGGLLERVEAGMLEASATRLTRLYDQEEEDLLSTLSFLRQHGFDVHAIKPNDPAANEFNIFFHRRGENWRGIESQLGLRGLPLYDGKHFWHLPADRLLSPEADLALVNRLRAVEIDLNQRNGALLAEVEALRQVVAAQANAEALRQELRREIEQLRAAEGVRHQEANSLRHEIVRGLEASNHQIEALRQELRREIEQLQATEGARYQEADSLRHEIALGLEASNRGYAAALESQREIARLETAKTFLQNAAVDLRAELEEARRQLGILRQDVQSEQAAAAHARAEAWRSAEQLTAFHRSSSWRLTGPLRRVARLLRR